jgi:hypothetical protein
MLDRSGSIFFCGSHLSKTAILISEAGVPRSTTRTGGGFVFGNGTRLMFFSVIVPKERSSRVTDSLDRFESIRIR